MSFTTAIPPEKPETSSPAKEVTATTAKLEGTLNPKTEAVTGYDFAYSATGKCTEGMATAAVAPAKLKDFKVPATPLTGLEPSRKYEACLVATNEAGETAAGNEVSFTTLASKPGIESESVSGVNGGSAHLEGVVNPNNQTSECKFRYGSEASLATGTDVLCEPASFPAEYGGQGVAVNLGGLEAGKTYYYRVLATNPSGTQEGTVEHFTTAIPPETPDAAAPAPLTATTATLHGVLNPAANGEAGSYEFAYSQSESECTGGKTAPEPAGGAQGNANEAVQAPITGLQPGVAYSVCLIAHNSAGETAQSSPVTFTTPIAQPTIVSESASSVETTQATLEAQIAPDGASTSYHFEYGPTETYGTSTPETTIETLNATSTVKVIITGLTPGTSYHYRVLATNAESPAGGTPGPDKTLSTPATLGNESQSCPNEKLRSEQPYALALPDCRAYEQVSPLNANGQDATDAFLKENPEASVSGEAVTYASRGDFANPTGNGFENQFLSRRGPSGWTTQAITPLRQPYQTETSPSYEATTFTPELTAGVASTSASLTGEAPSGTESGEFGLYVDDFAGGSYQYLGQGFFPEGASVDLSHVVNGLGGQVGEWVDGKVVPVGVANDGEAIEAIAGGQSEGPEYVPRGHDNWHAVSSDGSRVYFTSPAYARPGCGGCSVPPPGELYVREHVEQPQSALQTPEAEAAGTLTAGSETVTALTPIGSRPDAFAVGQQISGYGIPPGATISAVSSGDLTLSAQSAVSMSDVTLKAGGECTEPAKACTVDVSASRRAIPDNHGLQTPRYWAASADGSKVFFTSNADLTDDANTGPEDNAPNLYEYELSSEPGKPGRLTDLSVDKAGDGAAVLGVAQVSEDGSYVYFVAEGDLATGATAGAPNLYLSHDGGAPTFIVTLSTSDREDWSGIGAALQAGPAINDAVVSPGGGRLAFMSTRSLTGYDNRDAVTGEPDDEIFMYDAATGALVCASCNPTGARPIGSSELMGSDFDRIAHADYRSRNLPEDGTLFFDSADALVPHASDGRQNVYEYEDGQIHPLSDVAGGFTAFFLDASANGENVFFASADQLLPEDTSNNVVVWDA